MRQPLTPEQYDQRVAALRNFMLLAAGIVLVFMKNSAGLVLIGLAVPSSGPTKQMEVKQNGSGSG